jgi:1-acyl-sn-glycerol-3-phosphate acyltransferase
MQLREHRRRLVRFRTTLWTRLKQAALVLYRLCIRVRVVGRIGLPLRRGVIVVANHLNGADSIVLQAALRTRLFFVTSTRWFAGRFSRFIMWHVCDAIPAGDADPARNATGVRHCIETLRAGGNIGIYPEGTFNRAGRLEDIKDGAAYLAARTGSPIVPVCIRGLRMENEIDSSTRARECWTGFRSVAANLFNPDIELVVGDAIMPHDPDRAGLREEVARLNAELLDEFADLAATRVG